MSIPAVSDVAVDDVVPSTCPREDTEAEAEAAPEAAGRTGSTAGTGTAGPSSQRREPSAVARSDRSIRAKVSRCILLSKAALSPCAWKRVKWWMKRAMCCARYLAGSGRRKEDPWTGTAHVMKHGMKRGWNGVIKGAARRFVDYECTYRVRRASSCALPWSSTAKRELMNSSVTAAAEDPLPSPRAPAAAAAAGPVAGPLTSSVRKRLHWKKPPVLLLWRDQSCIQIQQKSWRHLRQVMWLHPSSFSVAMKQSEVTRGKDERGCRGVI